MIKKNIALILFVLFSVYSFGQEPIYFNNIYSNNYSDIGGNSVIEVQNGYLGFGAVHFPNQTEQYLVFLKIDDLGNELLWTPFGEENHNYYPGTGGGKIIYTNDGNLAIAFHIADSETVYGCLFKFTPDLDTLWKKHYYTEADWTIIQNSSQTTDNGFILVGEVLQNQYTDLILLKTDSLGNEQWHQSYGTNWSEKGRNVIQTPDGGYLIGGYFWKPGYDHSQDAMVIKTDSLGNQQWAKYYGNPNVDDDMAFVAMADDGNYLVATVYGSYPLSSTARIGRLNILKMDNNGDIIYNKKVGPNRLNLYIKNLRKLSNGYILSGFSKETDTATYQYYSGWMMKLDNNLDSVWYRDYIHEDEDWENFFYDAYPTTDNGYIAIGKARPDMGTNKMWVVKVDSMGCDTAGCITVNSEELMVNAEQGLRIWPNPVREEFWIKPYVPPLVPPNGGKPARIVVYNSLGVKVKEIPVPEGKETVTVNVRDWTKGIYYVRMSAGDRSMGSGKVVVE